MESAEELAAKADLCRTKLPVNPTRVEVLTQMRLIGRPVTPDALHKYLSGRVGRVSIYRVLAELVRVNLVSSFRLPRGKVVYTARQAGTALMIVCSACGDSVGSKSDALKQLLNNALADMAYSGEDLQILALCQRCSTL